MNTEQTHFTREQAQPTEQTQPTHFTREQIYKTVGKSHMAPSEYTYVLKDYANSEFCNLLNLEKNSFIGNLSTPNGTPYIINGLNKINHMDIWVINQEKQGYYYFWFKTKADATHLYTYVYDKKKRKEISKTNPIYKYTKQGWQNLNTFSSTHVDDLIGYRQYLHIVNKDLNNYNKYLHFLKSIGEGHRTLNYLLYGPPGTGKTTIIKTLATMHNLPIYIVNPLVMDNVSASTVLNPKHTSHANRIVLFEDFDRYLKEGEYSMSEILNELDGVESTEGCIRFFTCNDIEEINKHDALINRMSAKFEFFYPSIDDFSDKLNRFLTYWESKEWHEANIDKKNVFINMLNEKNNELFNLKKHKLTLRPFSNYIIRYLFEENCLDQMIKNINELVRI